MLPLPHALANLYIRVMAKSPKLTARIKSFADKLSGTSHVDNKSNPDSAYSRAMKKSEMSGPRKAFDFTAYKNAKSYGAP